MPSNPVKDVDFGTALNISLDNYYDLLKLQSGGLGADEFLQLKLVADTIDISNKNVSEGGYKWFSYFALLNRSDLEIEPQPISGTVLTGAVRLVENYGRFLQRLTKYAILSDLTPAEQLEVADLVKEIESLQDDAYDLAIVDRQKWLKYAELMGIDPGNGSQYLQWSNLYGKMRRIQQLLNEIKVAEFKKKKILDRQYKDPDDRAIVEAVFEFENPLARLRYPVLPDYEYSDGSQFSANYLANLPIGSTGIFDDRHVFSWDKTLTVIKNGTGGAFNASFDKNTAKSDSITTDWSGGGSASYGFIRVSASSSEYTSIKNDFTKGLKINLSAKSTTRIGFIYPAWFKASLFKNKYIKKHPKDFDDFFGPSGTLLYYPTAMIVVRGFSAEFISTQKWVYDYEKRFSAKAGGGFSAFGVSFGGSGSYSKHETQHQVDQSNTSLKIFDGDDTLRFVGYAVKKNSVIEEAVKSAGVIMENEE